MPVVGSRRRAGGSTSFAPRARQRDEARRTRCRAFDKLCRLLRYVDGDYRDPATFANLREQWPGPAARALLAIPPSLFGRSSSSWPNRLRQGGPGHRRKNRSATTSLGAVAQPHPARLLRGGDDLSHRPLLGKRPVHHMLFFRFANPFMASFWTATTSKACKSPWRRISASRAAARSTIRPAPCRRRAEPPLSGPEQSGHGASRQDRQRVDPR